MKTCRLLQSQIHTPTIVISWTIIGSIFFKNSYVSLFHYESGKKHQIVATFTNTCSYFALISVETSHLSVLVTFSRAQTTWFLYTYVMYVCTDIWTQFNANLDTNTVLLSYYMIFGSSESVCMYNINETNIPANVRHCLYEKTNRKSKSSL